MISQDWQEQAIEAFELAYKLGIPCEKFYTAEECGRLFVDFCMECGWHKDEHVAAEEGA